MHDPDGLPRRPSGSYSVASPTRTEATALSAYQRIPERVIVRTMIRPIFRTVSEWNVRTVSAQALKQGLYGLTGRRGRSHGK